MGLRINSSTGEISGTPKSKASAKLSFMPTQYSVTIKARNSGGTDTYPASIAVYEPPVIKTPNTLPDAYLGKSYTTDITATGTEWSMNWEVKSGKYTFTLELYNLVGNPESTTTKTFTITVKAAAIPDTIDGDFEDGTEGESYTSSFSYPTGVVILRYRLDNNNGLPPGLKLNISKSSATLKGTPTKAGTYRFTLTLIANDSEADTRNQIHPHERQGKR